MAILLFGSGRVCPAITLFPDVYYYIAKHALRKMDKKLFRDQCCRNENELRLRLRLRLRKTFQNCVVLHFLTLNLSLNLICDPVWFRLHRIKDLSPSESKSRN